MRRLLTISCWLLAKTSGLIANSHSQQHLFKYFVDRVAADEFAPTDGSRLHVVIRAA